MRILKVVCPECEANATIKKTNRKHKLLSDVYCACGDLECGHTFVLTLAYSHTLSPSAKTHFDTVKNLVGSIQTDEQEEMVKYLQASVMASRKAEQLSREARMPIVRRRKTYE
ncbi:ogr/Delta-like zinc finger family protein [Rahnella variigena]|jgi:hypothetical protein|uniref:ogr/Delta-like zinc finger family protein n=1 Tax=Rahnella variigena TaxID=574964 RepID=UPI001330C8F6|nr:ogr/Delta-like zinc finger family protein [Rahnella variigena]